MPVTPRDDAGAPGPRREYPPPVRAAVDAATEPARRRAAEEGRSIARALEATEMLRAAMLPTLERVEMLHAAMLPSRGFVATTDSTRDIDEMLAQLGATIASMGPSKAELARLESTLASLAPAPEIKEMVDRAVQVDVPQVQALGAKLAELVRSDVSRTLLKQDFTSPAQLLLPHLEGVFSAAWIAREVSGSYAAADAAMRTLEATFGRDLDEELGELDGGLLQGDEREQAVEDAARIADLVQQEGTSVIDLQKVVAWLSRKLAWTKDLSAAQKIELILVAIGTAAGVAVLTITLHDRGQVEEKITQLERTVDEGFKQQHEDQQETNAILRRVEELLERQANDAATDEAGERDQP